MNSGMPPGHVQLRHWLERRGFLDIEGARFLGFDKFKMSRLLSGDVQPTLQDAIKIQRFIGISVEAWAIPEEDLEPVGADKGAKRRVAK